MKIFLDLVLALMGMEEAKSAAICAMEACLRNMHSPIMPMQISVSFSLIEPAIMEIQ